MVNNSSISPADNDKNRIRVRVQPRREVDIQRLARAIIELAMHEAQADDAAVSVVMPLAEPVETNLGEVA